MKMGIRKPSIKKSIKARTTGKLKRKVKKAVNPLYGKKGMGMVKNPKKAVYNKVYNKTTIGVSDLLKTSSSSSRTSTQKKHTPTSTVKNKKTTISASADCGSRPFSAPTTTPIHYSAKTYKISGVILKILSVILILLSLLLLIAVPVAGILFALFGIALFLIGRGYTKKAKADIASDANDDATVLLNSSNDEAALQAMEAAPEVEAEHAPEIIE